MDLISVERSLVEEIPNPVGLNESFHTYKVCDDSIYPAARTGDVLCCSSQLENGTPWPRLAVVHYCDGTLAAVKSMPPRARFLWAEKVLMTVRR